MQLKKLAENVGIVCSLKCVSKEEDIDAFLADAYADACRPGNSKYVTLEDIKVLYKNPM